MRLLHAGADRFSSRLRQRRACRQRRGNPRIYEREYLPLRRLPKYRRGDQSGQVVDACIHQRLRETFMQPFTYARVNSLQTALAALPGSDSDAPAQILAGGTTLLDLM